MIQTWLMFVSGLLIGLSLGSGMGGWAVAGILVAITALTLNVPPKVHEAKTGPYRHPATGRYCHICGADGFAGEHCDSGLHS